MFAEQTRTSENLTPFEDLFCDLSESFLIKIGRALMVLPKLWPTDWEAGAIVVSCVVDLCVIHAGMIAPRPRPIGPEEWDTLFSLDNSDDRDSFTGERYPSRVVALEPCPICKDLEAGRLIFDVEPRVIHAGSVATRPRPIGAEAETIGLLSVDSFVSLFTFSERRWKSEVDTDFLGGCVCSSCGLIVFPNACGFSSSVKFEERDFFTRTFEGETSVDADTSALGGIRLIFVSTLSE